MDYEQREDCINQHVLMVQLITVKRKKQQQQEKNNNNKKIQLCL